MPHLSSFRFALISAAGLAVLPLAAAQEDWTFKLNGRLVADYTYATADVADADVSAGELRTARLGVSGEAKNLSFKLELATDSTGTVAVTDAYADFTPGGGAWTVRAGQFRTPQSLDEQTSQLLTSTFERAAFTDAFEFDRRLGLGAFHKGDRHTFAAGVFAANLNDTATQEGAAAAARFTYVPLKTDTLSTHIGASARWREIGEDQPLLRYRQRPYARDPGRIISTGAIADSDVFYGIEGAAILRKSSWVAAEYGALTATRVSGGDAAFNGGYVEAGHVFGGTRAVKEGKWDRTKVTRPVTDDGLGALQVSVRYDTLDQQDSGVDGGTLDTVILAANWLATSRARLGVNAFVASADYGASNSGLGAGFAAARTAGATSDDVTGVMARLQVDF